MAIEFHFCHRFVEAKMELYNGALPVKEIFDRWIDEHQNSNYGAFVPFVGIIRDEDGIEALSFDIYEPILQGWFDGWVQKAKEKGAIIKMAHAVGDVPVHTTSYMSAVFSSRRRVALEFIDEFVEDFKANAPIWKYDVIDGKRIYAEDRSTPMDGSGLMAQGDI